MAEVRSAFKMLARRYHPDKCVVAGLMGAKECEAKFIAVREGYEGLKCAMGGGGVYCGTV